MDVWEAIRTKRAVRQYTDQPLPDEVIERILDAGRRSQSSKNTQPWDFIAVRDRETLVQLSKTAQWMGHAAGAALNVVLIAPAEAATYAHYGFDIGQSAAYMQLAAHELGIGSCIGAVADKATARALLGYPEDKELVMTISFGYPADEQRQGMGKAGRRPLDEVVHWDRW